MIWRTAYELHSLVQVDWKESNNGQNTDVSNGVTSVSFSENLVIPWKNTIN